MKNKIIHFFYLYFPNIYKKRYFKHSNSITWNNFKEKNEEVELLLLNNFLKNNAVFFDVGANNGTYINYASKFTDKIYAFEPNPELFLRLKKLFSKVNLFNLALSNKSGNAQFKIPIINQKSLASRGTLNVDFKEDNEENQTIFDVKLNTLDKFVAKQKIAKIDVIKIDVEGHELEVIEGGKNTLTALKPILIIEIEERHHQNKNIFSIIQPILNLNYSCYYLDRTTKKLIQVDEKFPKQNQQEIKNKSNYINNFIFLSKH
jgi:FkbM family methyltransferase